MVWVFRYGPGPEPYYQLSLKRVQTYNFQAGPKGNQEVRSIDIIIVVIIIIVIIIIIIIFSFTDRGKLDPWSLVGRVGNKEVKCQTIF